MPKSEIPGLAGFSIPLPHEPAGILHIIQADYELTVWLKACLNGYFTIHTYPSGDIFLQFLEQNAGTKPIGIDAVLIDFMLPDMDGFELFLTIRQHALLKNIPIVALSANCHPDIRDKALYLGVYDYITKPFSINELRLRLLNALRRSKTYSGEGTFLFAEGLLTPLSQKFLQNIPDNKKKWMAQLLRLIEDNLQNEQMNIPLLSDYMSVSKRQLFRIIKESTGLSPNQLIQEIRLDKALHLLEGRSDMSVSDIAYSVGMVNPSYFATAFKKRFNKSPSAFKS